jgi:hypothetical protein
MGAPTTTWYSTRSTASTTPSTSTPSSSSSARVFALRKDYLNHLRGSPNHDGNMQFAKALLDLSCANDSDPGLSHPVLSLKPDFSVGQDIQELREIKDNIKDLLRSAAPAA